MDHDSSVVCWNHLSSAYLLFLQGSDKGAVTSRPKDSPLPHVDDDNDLYMVRFRKVVICKFFVVDHPKLMQLLIS